MNMKWAGDNWTLLLPGAGAGVAGLFLDLEQGECRAGGRAAGCNCLLSRVAVRGGGGGNHFVNTS